MKLLILMLVSLAAVACGVPQEEHDKISNRLSQAETKLDSVSTELKTVSSQLEANNKLVDGLKERIASIPQKPPTFSSGEASALVLEKIMNDITWTGIGMANAAYDSRFIHYKSDFESREEMCIPLAFLVDAEWANFHYMKSSRLMSSEDNQGDKTWLELYLQLNTQRISVPGTVKLTESYTDEGHWLVGLTWGDLIGPDNIFNDDPYQWKVYELSGAVERIGVDRTYC